MEPSDHEALRALVEGTAGETGEDFFRSLARNMARVLETHVAWVTEYLPESRRLRALAMWVGGRWVDDYEYELTGTPCAPVVEGREPVHFPDRLLDLFPHDPDLRPEGVVSYLGAPFLDTDGQVLGHLAVMDRRPMPADPRKRALFDIFANRAAAELRRLRAEKALRAREQELGLLVDSAMDAIVEIDPDRRITLINRAGEKLFGCRAQDVRGELLDRFLAVAAVDKLEDLIGKLDGMAPERGSLWIPGGFEAHGPDGHLFAAEATLSRFEMDGRSRYTLILRNVDERLEAEKRIRSLTVEAEVLREELRELRDVDTIMGTSPVMTALLAEVKQVAATDSTVLLLGETGTGKGLVARAVHGASPRRERPLVNVNCAAIPVNLMESEFFGHLKGAFTGATSPRQGRFVLADGGTIFLDEIGELPLDLQAKLLRVLQEGELEPVGGSRTQKVDVRVIAATNRDLGAAVHDGTFREDLFYRLNVFPIRVPPLRERGHDIGLLARAFAERYARRMGRRIEPLSDRCIRRLESYPWPGNVRELQNVIERAVITSRSGTLDLDRALPERANDGAPAAAAAVPRRGSPERPGTTATDTGAPGENGPARIFTVDELKTLETVNLRNALEATGWKVSGDGGAARLLGLKPSTLASRMKKLGLKKPV